MAPPAYSRGTFGWRRAMTRVNRRMTASAARIAPSQAARDTPYAVFPVQCPHAVAEKTPSPGEPSGHCAATQPGSIGTRSPSSLRTSAARPSKRPPATAFSSSVLLPSHVTALMGQVCQNRAHAAGWRVHEASFSTARSSASASSRAVASAES